MQSAISYATIWIAQDRETDGRDRRRRRGKKKNWTEKRRKPIRRSNFQELYLLFVRSWKKTRVYHVGETHKKLVDRIGSFVARDPLTIDIRFHDFTRRFFPIQIFIRWFSYLKDRYGRDTYRELSRDLQSTTIGQLRRYKLLLHLRKLMVVFVYLYSRAVNRIAVRCSSSFCPTRLDENEKVYRYRARRLMMIVENREIFVKLHGVDESSSEVRRIMPCKNVLHMKRKKKKRNKEY